MAAPGKYIIKFASVVMLILALASLIVLLTGGLVARAAETEGQPLLHASALVGVIANALPIVLELIAGLAGLICASHPKAGRVLTVLGLTALICAAVPLLANVIADGFSLRTDWQYAAGIIVAVIYIIGTFLNRSVANKKAPEPEFDN